MITMLEFWERVEILRKQAGISKELLCEKADINLKTYNGWLYKKVLPNIGIGFAIAKVLSVSSEYLVTGEELPLPNDDYVRDEAKPLLTPKGIITQNGEEPTILVPIAPQKISAGRGEDFLPSSEYVGYVRILERMARGIDPARLIAAIVKGDSMTGVQIFSGDVVIFARGYLDENGLYVVSLRGEILVKRMEFDRIHNQVAIISENKNYRPITVDANDEGVQILGKVVGWVHCYPY